MKIKLIFSVLMLPSLACVANITVFRSPTSPEPLISQTPLVATVQSSTPLLETQPVVVPEAISKFHMLDPQNGWMITDTSILRTQDGGQTWHNVTPPGAATLGFGTGASFLDSNRGWILIGDAIDPVRKGMLYRTLDGGMTWSSYATPFGGGEIHFLDDLNGWIMLSGEIVRGDEPAMFRSFFQGVRFFQSSDGGANWTQVYTNMPADVGAGDSLPYNGLKTGFTPISMQEAWVSGRTLDMNDFYLYHTLDGGYTWLQTEHSLPFTDERYLIYPPVFFDAQSGILPFEVGSEGGASLMFSFTEDGGKTWTTGEPMSGTSYYSVVSPYDIFIWAGNYTPSVSKDSGQSWTTIHSNVDLIIGLFQFQFVDAQTGWAATKNNITSHTSLYKTIDGGQTWLVLVP